MPSQVRRNFRQLLEYDEVLGHKYIPEQRACIQYGARQYFVATDALGFRNCPTRIPGELKIVVLGDSYTDGYGVGNELRFTDRLQEDYDCSVTNLAVSGYGVDQQLLAYERYGGEIEHDLVVFAPYLDDIARTCMRARVGVSRTSNELVLIPKPYFLLEEDGLRLSKESIATEHEAAHGRLFLPVAGRYPAVDQFDVSNDGYSDPNSNEWRVTEALIQRLKASCQGRPLIMLPLPIYTSVLRGDDSAHIQVFQRLVDNQASLHDVGPRLVEGVSDGVGLFFESCGHFTPEGHQLVADELAKTLKDRLGLKRRSSQVCKHLSRAKNRVYVMGISCFYHDSAACLIADGEIVAAAQEERFTRVKHDKSFPGQAVNYCLEEGGISSDQLEAVVYYDNESWTIERVLQNAAEIGEFGDEFWLKARKELSVKLRLPTIIRQRLGYSGEIYKSQHHLSHAASCFYPSPFEKAAILVVDGVGEWACTSLGRGSGNEIEILKQQFYPHSLGLLYSAFTSFAGFKVNSGEYKLMGLAPFGRPVYEREIRDQLVAIKADGSLRLNMEYFSFQYAQGMTNEKFAALFGGSRRQSESRISQRECDLAASVQRVTEEIVLKMAQHALEISDCRKLTMAGGVALNCVANGRLFDQADFDDIYFQPASGDAGGALGCALAWYYENHPSASREKTDGSSAYLGPSFSRFEFQGFLKTTGAVYHAFPDSERAPMIASWLAGEKIVGYFDGRMEFGPRALGARSILASPLNPAMQSKLNLSIKYRESFRPFAAIYKEERTAEYFDFDRRSPHMLIVRDVQRDLWVDQGAERGDDLVERVQKKRSQLPAITHVDHSVRLQSLTRGENERLYDVLDAFEGRTGKAVLINTSFNVRGEPIVCTPQDAYDCFLGTELDVLVLGDFYLLKSEQPEAVKSRSRPREFSLD